MNELWRRVRFLFGRQRWERELADEMAFHREMMEREGRSRASFGPAVRLREESGEAWGWGWLERLGADVRYGIRLLRRSPGFAFGAVAVVALAVGVNTAIVSVIRTALVNPAGLRDAGRIVSATVTIDKLKMVGADSSGAEYRDLRGMTQVFQAVTAVEDSAWTLDQDGEVSRWLAPRVTPEFFAVFGAQPVLGRFFAAGEENLVVLAHDVWRTRYGGDPNVLGRALKLDGKPHRIVGVAPADFHFPAGVEGWTPLALDAQRLNRRGYNMSLALFARLRPGVGEAQARERIAAHNSGLHSAASPEAKELRDLGYRIEVQPLAHFVAGDLRRPLLLLWTAALVVLLTGCANVAGLLLARTSGRVKEMAVRLSLGAPRSRILRQLLVESLLLGAAGGVAGLALARAALDAMRALPLPEKHLLELVTLDARMLLYGIALALASALLFGIAPAVQVLRQSQAQAMSRARRRRFQGAFVAAEVACALVLLVATGLLVRSLWAVQNLQIGFDPAGLHTAYLSLPKEREGYQERLVAALRAAPGVEGAALAYPLPFSGGGLTSGFGIKGRTRRQNEPEWHGEAYMVWPGYLQTMRIPLLRGRDLAETDTKDSPLVCVIDRLLADRFFPGEDPIGREISMYRGAARIVGIAAAVRATSQEEGSRPTVYYALRQVPFFANAGVVVRSAIPAAGAIRQAVREAGPGAPVYDLKTMDERIGQTLGVRRVVVALLTAFAALSLLLAMVGVHGVLAQVVGERRGEIGIRMALGARPGQILAHYLGMGVRLGAVGALAGMVVAAGAARLVDSFLFRTKALDPVMFALAVAGLALAVIVAAGWPALRAARVAPQEALRYE